MCTKNAYLKPYLIHSFNYLKPYAFQAIGQTSSTCTTPLRSGSTEVRTVVWEFGLRVIVRCIVRAVCAFSYWAIGGERRLESVSGGLYCQLLGHWW